MIIPSHRCWDPLHKECVQSNCKFSPRERPLSTRLFAAASTGAITRMVCLNIVGHLGHRKKKSQIEGVRGVPQWLECCEILNIVKIPNKFSIEKSLKWLEWNNGICGFPIFAPSHMLAMERSLSRNKRVGTPKLETRPLQPLFI